MEIMVTFFCSNVNEMIRYYIDVTDKFDLMSISDDKAIAFLSFKEDKRIKIQLKKSEHQVTPTEISLQVKDAEALFDHIEAKQLIGHGIKKDAFSYKGQAIPLLTSPIGNYFCSVDPSGNMIIFFDKIAG